MSLTARLIAVLVLFAAISAGLWKVYHTGYTRGSGDVQSEYQAKALEAERQARAAEQAKVQAVNQVDQRYRKEVANVKAAHDSAVLELDGLRSILASSSPAGTNTATASGLDDLSRARFVVGQCASVVTEMAQSLDDGEARLKALQDYVKSILTK